MTEIEKGRWHLEGADPAQVLGRLAGQEKVMIVLRHAGATHERIGAVGAVAADGDRFALGGPVHTARVDPAAVRRIVLDTSSEMRGKFYPAIEFQEDGDEVLFSAIAMEGAEAFVAAVDTGTRVEIAPKERRMPSMSDDTGDMSADPGFVLLDRLRAGAAEVEIRMTLDGREQSWRGRIEEVRPAMGFANVMTGDFHLHLKAGAVADWRETPEGWVALDADGAPTGLQVAVVPATPA
ncbi:hypothetical protein ATO6_14855 [Oceanicola sp. 22II-s10i]|uniref:hypothetical protein n=1 Tax=Oceanicola sp. 22II-s10i TaxID=1317116 RepID=UPI000B520EB4|nr:hypothetical protein [Oceanicola sp. 22II-s10i]OWU84297.1 hypothetical protein ATO6_14855 [Oceanicola sp. 22II-s10i]